MKRKQHGFALLEVIVGAGVLGVALAAAGMYANKQAEIQVKEKIASNVVEFVWAVKRYSSYAVINEQRNPLNLEFDYGAAEHVFPGITTETPEAVYISDNGLVGHNRFQWLKQAACYGAEGDTVGEVPDQVHPQGIGRAPDGPQAFISCDESLSEIGLLDYVGTAFRFDGVGTGRHSTTAANFFRFDHADEEEKKLVFDYATYIQLMAERKGTGAEVRFHRFTLSGDDLQNILVNNSMSYTEFLEDDEAREEFLRRAGTDFGELGISVSFANHHTDALLRDGSVSMIAGAGLCWDATVPGEEGTTPCIAYRPDTGNMDLTSFNGVNVRELEAGAVNAEAVNASQVVADQIAFKVDATTYKTPIQSEYQFFTNADKSDRGKVIDMINCPSLPEGVTWQNKFAAVLNSFTSAGDNADFSDSSAKESEGHPSLDGQHPLVSGLSIDWSADLPSRKWEVQAAIGIQGDVLDGGADVLRNPYSMSFISMQWCEGTVAAP